MPRINQLPAASSVAQTDVLAIDTTDKTYKVPRSVLAPAPYIATIPTGQWSGSGSDRYITVTASNVTANAMLYPFYDKASDALLNGPVWVIPADGSFTIHTSAIPSGTVTISVLLAGIVGEVNYQVLADVYSRAQVDTIVSQSTAYASGNSETFGNASIGVAGFITSGSQQMNFFVPLPKSLANISTITCTRFTGLIRGSSGYVNNVSDSSTNWATMSGMTVTVQKSGTNMVRIMLASSSALSNVTNNTPLQAFALVTLNFS